MAWAAADYIRSEPCFYSNPSPPWITMAPSAGGGGKQMLPLSLATVDRLQRPFGQKRGYGMPPQPRGRVAAWID